MSEDARRDVFIGRLGAVTCVYVSLGWMCMHINAGSEETTVTRCKVEFVWMTKFKRVSSEDSCYSGFAMHCASRQAVFAGQGSIGALDKLMQVKGHHSYSQYLAEQAEPGPRTAAFPIVSWLIKMLSFFFLSIFD